MKRRQFLTTAAFGAAGAAVAAPAVAQSAPEVKWRLASAFPRSQDILFGAAETFSRYVSECSDGRFQVQSSAAGEIPGTAQPIEAVSANVVEMAHAAPSSLVAKDPAYGIVTGAPFGLNTRGQNAWYAAGGGIEMSNELFAKSGLYALPGGNGGAHLGAWLRREIRSVEDLKGLKIRIGGIAAQVVQKLGAAPQALPDAEIRSAFERGAIDAAAGLGPYDDDKLGLVKAAPYIYYPGWWEGSAGASFWFGQQKWRELPKAYQAIATAAAARVNADVTARYDARNPAAVRRLVGSGAQLRPFPQDVLEAAYKAASDTYAEISAGNADFKKIWDSVRAFRGEEYLWFQVAEYPYDNFMIRTRARGG